MITNGEALDCQANSHGQHFKKYMKNMIGNMHTNVGL